VLIVLFVSIAARASTPQYTRPPILEEIP
jgi:hypothetical protein